MEMALTMPKAELHLHIEGTLEPHLAFELARRNNVKLPYPDEESLRKAYNFDSLQSFLDLYYTCADVLRTRQDFADLMLAYLEHAARDKVVYAEIFFDPQTHTQRKIPFNVVIGGLHDGIKEGHKRWGISARLVMCFLRHLSQEECLASLEDAKKHLAEITAFGLDSGERGNPPKKFTKLFEACRTLNKPVVAHAGEEGPAEYIQQVRWRLLDFMSICCYRGVVTTSRDHCFVVLAESMPSLI